MEEATSETTPKTAAETLEMPSSETTTDQPLGTIEQSDDSAVETASTEIVEETTPLVSSDLCENTTTASVETNEHSSMPTSAVENTTENESKPADINSETPGTVKEDIEEISADSTEVIPANTTTPNIDLFAATEVSTISPTIAKSPEQEAELTSQLSETPIYKSEFLSSAPKTEQEKPPSLKRCFDVAFLTGAHDKKVVDIKPTECWENEFPRSAFSKVIKARECNDGQTGHKNGRISKGERGEAIRVRIRSAPERGNSITSFVSSCLRGGKSGISISSSGLIPQSNLGESLDNPFVFPQMQSTASSTQQAIMGGCYNYQPPSTTSPSSNLRKLIDPTSSSQHLAPAATSAQLSAAPTGLVSAALGLTAPSNTCAKCGIVFRMTSDLVYHMRTHHSRMESESYEKRREFDRLKCHVCGENFKERHHLTRHMTAHQDRTEEEQQDGTNGRRQNNALFGAF